ncbi:3-deoxy-manno-octulosonate cytidylyltransferase [Planctomycetes bacterium Pan216]|uniref:3-deoxy-manno-octulosonate cytidylyltransferase n=1 Tax=Kolteria novifilia TaxID=2527975 RepID=A0A518B8A3_9BACT|nr:3-deoxy-manno-octulosonate cytidylyltransferase [Planctomycetes bacterium Pan216]
MAMDRLDGAPEDQQRAQREEQAPYANRRTKGMTGIIVIPARRASTRLPEKLLLRDTGKPLLHHAIDRAREAVEQSGGLFADIVVAYDDEELGEIARGAGVRSIRTSDRHECGTTRIAEAVEELSRDRRVDVVVNLQADEPEIEPEALRCVAEELVRDRWADMATLAIPMPPGTEEGMNNPNAVKVALDTQGRAVYFSRAPIPYRRNAPLEGEALWHHHLGIYAYRYSFLKEFAALPVCPLERIEGLEQLRALNAGRRIRVGQVPASWAGKGIDTVDDYRAFVNRMAA